MKRLIDTISGQSCEIYENTVEAPPSVIMQTKEV